MSLPSQMPTLSCGSSSSSVYSEDALISEVNSNGIQVHHQSHLRPTIGGVPRENGQNFEQPSDLSLNQDNTMLNQDGSASNLHSVNSSTSQYRFETPTEAALRQLEARSHIRAKRDENERKKHLEVWKDGLLRAYAQGSVQEVNQMRLSPYSWNYDDEWFLQDHSELDSSDSSLSRAYLPTQRAAIPDFLSGSPTSGVNGEDSMETRDEPMMTCLKVPNNTKPQGSMKLRDNLPDSQPAEANLLSNNSRKYGLGDHVRGYVSGHYVTELEGHEESPQEMCKRRELVKNSSVCDVEGWPMRHKAR